MADIRSFEELKRAVYGRDDQIKIYDPDVQQAVKQAYRVSNALIIFAVLMVVAVGVAIAFVIVAKKFNMNNVRSIKITMRDFQMLVKFQGNVGTRTITDMKKQWKIAEPFLLDSDYQSLLTPLVLVKSN